MPVFGTTDGVTDLSENATQTDVQLKDAQHSLNDNTSRGLPSTASTLITEVYNRDQRAREPVTGDSSASNNTHQSGDRSRSTPSHESAPYAPFHDDKDYAFAKWMSKYKLTKGAANAFLRDADLEAMREGLSYRNGAGWLARLHRIPYGIPDYGWTADEFSIDSHVSGLTDIVIYIIETS